MQINFKTILAFIILVFVTIPSFAIHTKSVNDEIEEILNITQPFPTSTFQVVVPMRRFTGIVAIEIYNEFMKFNDLLMRIYSHPIFFFEQANACQRLMTTAFETRHNIIITPENFSDLCLLRKFVFLAGSKELQGQLKYVFEMMNFDFNAQQYMTLRAGIVSALEKIIKIIQPRGIEDPLVHHCHTILQYAKVKNLALEVDQKSMHYLVAELRRSIEDGNISTSGIPMHYPSLDLFEKVDVLEQVDMIERLLSAVDEKYY